MAFGEHDWVLLADLPDNVSVAAFTLTVSKSGSPSDYDYASA
jgi:uncharacterized protein with GYD domain